jgi:hypothetical protein
MADEQVVGRLETLSVSEQDGGRKRVLEVSAVELRGIVDRV